MQPYLMFNGECEAALAFYADIFGGSVDGINRYAGSPMEAHAPPGSGDKIMHSSFHAPGVTFMASDSFEPPAPSSRIRLSIGSSDPTEGERIFSALAAGGTVKMPYAKQFWGASFGLLVDKFGIEWMVNAGG